MKLVEVNDPTDSRSSWSQYEPSSAYVWIFYTPLVGLPAMGCYCYLASLVEQGCSEIGWQDISEILGFEEHSRVVDALCALSGAGMVELAKQRCGVRLRLPVLDSALEAQLPPRLRFVHSYARKLLADRSLGARRSIELSALDRLRRQARSAAVSLLERGKTLEEVEADLAAQGFHPSLVASSAVWAVWHLVATSWERAPLLTTFKAKKSERPRLLTLTTHRR